MTDIWILAANGSQATLFRAESPTAPLVELETLANPEARAKQMDLLSDRPGRTFDSFGAGRHAKAVATEPKEQEQIRFAKSIAERLERGRLDHGSGGRHPARLAPRGRGGVIVNISSISRAGNIGQTNYAAAKAGVSAMTATWSQELARYGIRVAGMAPGFSETRMVARMKSKMRKQFEQRIPLHRFAKPHEIAHSALYILENEYFNGRTLEVDGGLRL